MSAVERGVAAVGSMFVVVVDDGGRQISRAKTAAEIVQNLIDAGWHDGPKYVNEGQGRGLREVTP